MRVGGAECEGGGAGAGDGRGVRAHYHDRADRVADGDIPVGGVPRAGVPDDEVADGGYADSKVGIRAVVPLDAVVGARQQNPRSRDAAAIAVVVARVAHDGPVAGAHDPVPRVERDEAARHYPALSDRDPRGGVGPAGAVGDHRAERGADPVARVGLRSAPRHAAARVDVDPLHGVADGRARRHRAPRPRDDPAEGVAAAHARPHHAVGTYINTVLPVRLADDRIDHGGHRDEPDPIHTPGARRPVPHDHVLRGENRRDAAERTRDTLEREPHQVERHPARRDLNPVLAHHAGDVPREVVASRLRDLEQAVRITRRVGGVDGGPRLDLVERLVRTRHRSGGRIKRARDERGGGEERCRGEGEDGISADHELVPCYVSFECRANQYVKFALGSVDQRMRLVQNAKLAHGSVVPIPPAPELPLMAPLAGGMMMTPTVFPAAML